MRKDERIQAWERQSRIQLASLLGHLPGPARGRQMLKALGTISECANIVPSLMVKPLTDEATNFLHAQRIGVIATFTEANTPHAATVHFSCNTNTIEFFIATNRDSLKCQQLIIQGPTPASFVCGFSEENCITFQATGAASIITDKQERADFITRHYTKFPEHAKRADAPETAFIKFTTSWWRFSDYMQKPPFITASE